MDKIKKKSAKIYFCAFAPSINTHPVYSVKSVSHVVVAKRWWLLCWKWKNFSTLFLFHFNGRRRFIVWDKFSFSWWWCFWMSKQTSQKLLKKKRKKMNEMKHYIDTRCIHRKKVYLLKEEMDRWLDHAHFIRIYF